MRLGHFGGFPKVLVFLAKLVLKASIPGILSSVVCCLMLVVKGELQRIIDGVQSEM